MTNSELLHLLRCEVIPAIGCTEPIAVALCTARAKELLGAEPDKITVYLSKNVYKNALAVGIPNTGMTGLPIAIALGATVGKSEYMLEVLRDATPEAVAYAKQYMLRVPATIKVDYDAPSLLYIHVEVANGDRTAQATIIDEHTNFVPSPIPNSQSSNSPKGVQYPIGGTPSNSEASEPLALSLRRVYDFAMEVGTHELTFLLEGAQMNTAAAETSFAEQYGHGLGRLLRPISNSEASNSPQGVQYPQADLLAGLCFQQELERLAFAHGSAPSIAPAQRLRDFVEGRKSSTLPACSYLPGVRSSSMHEWLPEHIGKRLQQGFRDFDRKYRGFLTNEAVILGVESRSSSAVRIPRDPETLQSISTPHLYPCGEGAGYAGGITSSALDGINAALKIAEQL